MLNKRNKKGQIGEQLEDIVCFVLIGVLLFILFLLAVVLHRSGVDMQERTISEKIVNDQVKATLNALEREKQEDKIFSDLIREKNEQVSSRISDELIKCGYGGSCVSIGRTADTILIYQKTVEECKKINAYRFSSTDLQNALISKKTCFIIPGKEPIAIKAEILNCAGPRIST